MEPKSIFACQPLANDIETSVCVKLPHPRNGSELSISFNDSCGAMENLGRVEIVEFDKKDNIVNTTSYCITTSVLHEVIGEFLSKP